MGCSSSAANVELKSIEAGETTVFGDAYVSPPGKNTLIWMKTKLWDKDAFKIKNVTNGSPSEGADMFQVESASKKIIDFKTQTPVFFMKEPQAQSDDSKVMTPDGQTGLFDVHAEMKKQNTVGLKNSAGTEIRLEGNMSMVTMKGCVCLGDLKTGAPIAKLWSHNQREDLLAPGAADDYIVEISPGVDICLVVAVLSIYEKAEGYMV